MIAPEEYVPMVELADDYMTRTEADELEEQRRQDVMESEIAYSLDPELGQAWERLNARSGCCGRPVRRLGHGLRCDEEAE